MKFLNKILTHFPKRTRFQTNYYSTVKAAKNVDDITKIRNIGILAHIDAGKTTTTERMLFYSGIINQMGEVHHGNTVTDYMEQERERGITITSAAVTFNWKKHQFNLIDTPGHIDFTIEVEQTLNVLDGAVVILDGSAGVEAQTITVWKQAEQYKIPRLVFVNKMDRLDGDLKMCCESLKKKLETEYLVLQHPYRDKNGKLIGILDLLSMESILYDNNSKQVKTSIITESEQPELFNEVMEGRRELIDRLTDFNDELANIVIASDSMDSIKSSDIVNALKDVTLKQVATPVLMGSAYKNIGIQSLMDAIILYLPSPNVRSQFSCFEDNLCARSFKIIHDKQKGALVFLRLYNGSINKNQKIYSIQQDLSEQIGRLYIAFADDFREVESVANGNIAVVTGAKKIQSGDLITNSQSASQKAKRNFEKNKNNIDNIFELKNKTPEPVFFCSIEPPSLASQAALDQALIELQREDPSLKVSQNAETGQTVLGGMGELHLEIIKDRILKEYKIDAELGKLQIAYREAPVKKLTDQISMETKIGNSKQSVFVRLSLLPIETTDNVKEIMRLDRSPEAASGISTIFPKHLLAVKQGIEVGLLHGPKINSKVVNTQVMLHFLEVGRGTSDSMISASVTQLVQKLLRESGSDILEPIMNVEIVVPEEHLSTIMADLSRRRAIINNVLMRGNSKEISAEIPLSELRGYSTTLRTLSSGTATYSMEFLEYKRMSSLDESKAIAEVRGF